MWIFVSEAMAGDIEGITSSLWSSIEQITLPFDATKRAQMTMRATNDVIQDNVVEFSS
jgi:hypothetical protein